LQKQLLYCDNAKPLKTASIRLRPIGTYLATRVQLLSHIFRVRNSIYQIQITQLAHWATQTVTAARKGSSYGADNHSGLQGGAW
jgi:hypothetical protein